MSSLSFTAHPLPSEIQDAAAWVSETPFGPWTPDWNASNINDHHYPYAPFQEHTLLHIHIHTHTHVNTHICIHIHAHTFAHIHTHIHTCTYTNAITYLHKHRHTTQSNRQRGKKREGEGEEARGISVIY